jgi:prepilin-type N-terminal cleavage/methylation domain-containing protein
MVNRLGQRRGGILRRAFSLIELVIVVVIIGIIAAIAIPRMSRGAEGASDSALIGNLATLRNAIDLYHTEHEGVYPTAANIVAQLTQYSDINGGTSATKTSTHIYGPYIREIPKMPVKGDGKGDSKIAAAAAADVGWIYTESTGSIVANSAEKDARNVAYNSY